MNETFQLDIIAPDRTLLSEKVTMAVIPGSEGDFGVLSRHAPVMSSLRPGIINIQLLNDGSGGADKRQFFVGSGFVSVENNSCIILADYAKPLSEIKRDEIVSRIEKITADLEIRGDDSKLRQELIICEAMLAVAIEQR